MSYEGRVMPAEAVQDTAPERVTPSKCYYQDKMDPFGRYVWTHL